MNFFRPGGTPEPPKRHLNRLLSRSSGPGGSRRPPGLEFGASGAPFWHARGSILEAPSVAFAGAPLLAMKRLAKKRWLAVLADP